jgi:predicted nucleotidyltransferase
MAELLNSDKIKSSVAPVLQGLLDDALPAVQSAGCRLESAVLFGSAASSDYAPGRSDINVYLVTDCLTLPLLKALNPVFKKHIKKLKSNPVVLDREYIAGSTDVFPMEFLEWKEQSIVFYGADPLENLEIGAENLRLSIEENLRGKRLRMIQSYFELDPRRRPMQPFLMSVLPNFLVVARNILRLLDVAVSSDKAAMIGALERKSGVELKAFKRLLRIRQDGMKAGADEAEILFKQFLAEIDALIGFIDQFKTSGRAS